MSKNRRFHRFNTRPESGSVGEPTLNFSSEIVARSNDSLTRVSDDEIIGEAFQILARRFARSSVLAGTATAREYVALRYAGLEYEVFTCIFLDVHHRVIACEDLFRGTLSTSSVHPREVAKRALALNAASVILAHNHPSGVAEPSQADELITRRLRDALALLDIRVLDHLVVGGSDVTSLVERGLL